MNVFLDLDGTVIDSRKRLFMLFQCLANENPISFEEYWKLKRAIISNEWILEHKLSYTSEQIARFRTEWMEKIESWEYLLYDVNFPFTKKVLGELQAKGNAVFLVTARQSVQMLEKQLRHLGLQSYFAEIFVTENKCEKVHLIKQAGISLKATDVFIGDTGKDIETAKLLRIRSIAVTSGFRSQEVLKKYQPDFICENILAATALI